MRSCKNICIVQDCQNKPEFYVNFSRYHKFCSTHVSVVSSSDTSIMCQNCQNSILCIKGLPHQSIAEYKTMLKTEVNLAQSPIPDPPAEEFLKCSHPRCNSRKAKKICDVHNLCENHQQNKDLGPFCHLCKCSFCGSYGVMIKKCGTKTCFRDVSRTRCCFVCCKYSDNFQNLCGHYLCDVHFDSQKMCPCVPCEICKTQTGKSRLCGHRVCEFCEIQGYCTSCMTGTCQTCSSFRPLFRFSCNVHSFCEFCYRAKAFCDLCMPLCFRCGLIPSVSTSCRTHPLCSDCSSFFSPGFCVYCVNPVNFTCQSCLNTFQRFTEGLNCDHRICQKCSVFSCGHQECPTCTKIRGICVRCKPSHFCIGCKNLDVLIELSCSHGFCKNCGEQRNDEHFSCKNCISHQFWVNGKCLKCENSFCNFCQEFKETDLLDCGHKCCQECLKTMEKCLICRPFVSCFYCKKNKQREKDSCEIHEICTQCREELETRLCIVCEGIEEDFRCSFCRFYYSKTKMEKFKCRHQACPGCLRANEKKCELCGDCEVCQSFYKKQSIPCNHVVCERCSADYNTEQCIVCTSLVILCQACQIYQKPHKCLKNHLICHECSQAFEDKFGKSCFICDPQCYFCLEKNPVINPSCKHLMCRGCYDELSVSSSSCLLCDTADHRCDSCEKVFLPKDFSEPTCIHQRCLTCSNKELCKKCDVLKTEENISKSDIKEVVLSECKAEVKSSKQKQEFECFGLFCEDHKPINCQTCSQKFCQNSNSKGKFCFDCKNQVTKEITVDIKHEAYQNLRRKIKVLNTIKRQMQLETNKIIKNIQSEHKKKNEMLETLIKKSESLLKNFSGFTDNQIQQALTKTYVKSEVKPFNSSEISSFFNQDWFQKLELDMEVVKSIKIKKAQSTLASNFKLTAVSADSKYLAVNSFHNLITVWEIPGLNSFNLIGHKEKITGFTFFNEKLISYGKDGSILLWNLESRTYESLTSQPIGPILGLGVSLSTNSFNFFNDKLKVMSYNFSTKAIRDYGFVYNQPQEYLFTEDSKFFIFSYEHSMKIFNIPQLKLIDVQIFPICTSVYKLSNDSSTDRLFVILNDRNLIVFDLKTLKKLINLKIFESQPICTFFDSKVFMVYDSSGLTRCYDNLTFQELSSISTEVPDIQTSVFLGSTQLLTITKSSEVILTDLEKIKICNQQPFKFSFSLNKDFNFAGFCISDYFFISDLSTDKIINSGQITGKALKSLSFSSDCEFFLICSDETCKVFNQFSSEVFEISSKNGFDCASLSDDSTLIATAEGSEVSVWDLPEKKKVLSFELGHLKVSDLKFSWNNEVCIIAGFYGNVVVWDLAKNQIWKSFDVSIEGSKIFYVSQKQRIAFYDNTGIAEVLSLKLEELLSEDKEEVLALFNQQMVLRHR